ncbi:MAG TPA: hypothetical protein VLA52_15515 [Thermohalobaculum sp.]|nr:hypothetical protein [Thermohalobaculum sp.]
MLMVIVSVVTIVRFSYDPPPYSGLPFEITLTPEETRAELDRLAELRDQSLPSSLGSMASAAQGCIQGSLGKTPDAEVLQAARRFFLMIFAMRNRFESPLIDPRIADIPLDGPPSVDGLLDYWRSEGASKATADRWRWILAHYARVDHPIYTGIAIEPGGWANADLDKLFLSVKLSGESFISCYRSRSGG